CSVHSALPFRLQLRRHGARLGEERHLQESGNSSWEIPRASKAEEGTYECTAVSGAGTGRAQAEVIVTDPPPQLVPAPNVTVSPGETAVLSCRVLGEAPHNLTWVRDWRVLPASTGRVRQLDDLSLEVSAVVPSDGGRYQCIASNANGVTRASAWLLVREAPKVSIHTRSQRFSQGVEVRVSCSASGYPAPHISWSRDGHTLQEDSRGDQDPQGPVPASVLLPLNGRSTVLPSSGITNERSLVHISHLPPRRPTLGLRRPRRWCSPPVGQEAVLACEASGVPPPRLIWYREGLEMILAPEDSSSGVLRIPVARERDAGVYTCRAVNELGAASAEIRLEVGHAPRLMELPREVTVELGRSALLACRAAGRPPPTVTWRRADSQPLQPGRGSRARQPEAGVLFFESVVPEDQAPYVCEAQNVFGKVQAETQLLVTGHAPPQIASGAPTVRVLERQPVSLPCIILAGRPFPERRWLKAGQPLPAGSRHSVRADGSLHLDRALQEDAGKYSCVVTNTAGSQHRHVQLVVQEVPPRIRPTATHHVTNEGVPASLPCVASGVPTPTVTWTKETNALASGGPHYNVSKDGTLVIAQPSPRDAGTYVCTATNSVGFSSQEMRLSVNTKPRIHGNFSHDTDEPLRVTAKAGDEVTLDCEAQGSPPPLVTWTKDSHPVPAAPDRHRLLPSGSLRLAQAQAGDSGLYRCRASNPAGSAARHYVLGVQVPPQVQPGPRVLKVLAGEAVDLNCAAEGTPEPRLNWSKDGEALRGGGPEGSVHFAAIRTSDAGMYRCEAANSAGVDAWELELRVLEPPHWGADETGGLLERVAGENASLPCPARVKPRPLCTWGKCGGNECGRLPGGQCWALAGTSPVTVGWRARKLREPGTCGRLLYLSLCPVPPSIREDGRRANVSGMAGQALTLECDANGFPAPEIAWFKDGQLIPEGDSHRLLNEARALHLPRIQAGDSGLYSCRAENAAGTAQRDFELLVLIPPSVLGAGAAQEVLGLAGAQVELECRTSGVPTPQVEWTKDRHPGVVPMPGPGGWGALGRLNLGGGLTGIARATRAQAEGSVGTSHPSLALPLGSEPLLGIGWGMRVCVFIGTYDPNKVERHILVPSSPHVPWRGLCGLSTTAAFPKRKGGALGLAAPLAITAGGGTCRSSGFNLKPGEPMALSAVDTEPYFPPTIEGASEGPHLVKAVAGRPLGLECVARGYPPPTLSWHHEGLPLAESNGTWLEAGGGLLSLDSLGEASGGLYSCVASSPAGEAVLQYAVDVQGEPDCPARATGCGPLLPHLPPASARSPSGELPLGTWEPGGRTQQRTHSAGNSQWTEEMRGGGTFNLVHVPELQLPEGESGGKGSVPKIRGIPWSLSVWFRTAPRAKLVPMPPFSRSWVLDPVPQPPPPRDTPLPPLPQIEKVDLRDEGVYTCVATNLAGESRRDAVLKVLGTPLSAPIFTFAVLFGLGVPLHPHICGQVLALATLHALRVPRAHWGGLFLAVGAGAVLEGWGETLGWLRSELPTKRGRFLSPLVPPNIEPVPANKAVLENASVTLECLASGVPPPGKPLLKQAPTSVLPSGGQVFPGGRTLTLASARASDSGTYSCVAVSAVGEDRRDVALHVHVPPSILGEELNVSVVANESVALECQSHAVPPPVLSWRKDGRPLEPRPGARLSADKALLEVDRAEVRDAGRYTCEALNQAGRSEKHYNLNVWVPPVFPSREPHILTVTEGHPTRLSCECRGVPFPKITWRKDGQPVPGEGAGLGQVSAVGRLLYLGPAQPAQEGTYTCECSNVAGNSSQDQQLEVHGEPGRGDLSQAEGVSVVQDAEATLECSVTGKPPPRVTWQRDGQPVGAAPGLRLQNQGQSLHVERAQAAHAGRYSCLAENVAGRAERRFALSVLVPPELIGDSDPLTNVTAALHSPLTLLCEATGIPPPGVRWFRGEEPISPGEDTYLLAGGWMLKVTRTQERDRGLYSCLASNEAGEVRRNFSVEVLVPPSIENEDLEEVVKVPEGQTANLTCNATGHPQPRVTWFKDGRPLAGGDTQHVSPDGALLQVLQANLSSAGHYSCIAANAAGERTKHVQLSVLVAPSILGVTEDGADEEVTVTINNPISLICEALAFPAPTITWMKDGSPFEASNNIQLLPGTHGLQILNAQKEDAGQYTCVVTNGLGEAVKNYHVEVLIPPSISKDDSMGEVGVKEVKTKVNSTLTLECECAAPPPAISWYKDGRDLAPSLEKNHLVRRSLASIRHELRWAGASFLCPAQTLLNKHSLQKNPKNKKPPVEGMKEEARGGVTEYREVVENNPAYLYCDTNAVPPPELTWYREDQPLSATDGVSVLQGGRVLQIPLVRAEDAGRYSCKASNEVGEDWLHYELMVLTPPVIPGDTEELVEEVTVNASSTVSLQCPALGNPMPTISWLQNGLPFSPSPRLQVLEDGQVLQVSTAEVADVASYMCVAENPAGSVEKLFTLRVQGGHGAVPPHITGLDSEQVTAILNSSVSLPCDVRAHPSPEVTWYKDGQALSLGEDVFLLPGTHTLQLARAQLADSGTYMCEALNAAGRDQKLVRLSVLVPPTFRQALGGPQDGVPVRAGDKAVLSCETDSLPEPAVTWYKDGQPLVLAPRTQTLQGGQKLAILDTQVSDKGVYSCKVNNTAGEAMRAFVLTVQVPPTFENPKTETVSQVAGSPLVLTCDVTGVPAPRVTWLRDRMPIAGESSVAHGVVSRGGRLQLSRLQPAQAGTYTCVAENAQAEARKDFTVAVLAPAAVAPRIRSAGAPQEHSVLEGQEVRLDCEADGQTAEVAWLKDGRPLGQGVGPPLRFYLDSGSLVLKGLMASDSGAYTCVAHNAAGEDARLHTVSVLGPPTIEQGTEGAGPLVHRAGELVTMACPVRGSPPIHMSWLKDGLPLPLSQRTHLHGSGRILRISRVQLADAGVFTCVAASPAGVADRNFTLQVHDPLPCTVPPVLEPAEFQNNVAVVRGSPVVLPCEAQGSPLPLVSWMKDGEPLFLQSLEQGPSLQLETAGAGDSGTYSCVAVSEAGEARRHFQLTVMDPPHMEDSGQPAELSLTPGAPLELRCDARGTPLPNITWHKDGQALDSQEDSRGTGQRLRVEAVQVGDDGLYTCVAHNPAGEIEKSFRVRVQAPPNVIGPEAPLCGWPGPGQLVLECSVEADPAPEIEWHRDGILLQADAHTQFPEQGRFLQLQALSTADSGNYSCTARNARAAPAWPSAWRSTVSGPAAPRDHQRRSASVNQTILLPCQAEGAPPPLMSWRKDGAPLDLGSPRLHVLPEGSLRIQPVLAQDSGHYLCLASNSAGSDRQARDLRVFEPPAIAPSPSNLTLTAHTPASLPCEARGSPKPLVAWWKDGQKLDFRLQQGAYRLLPSNALLLAAPGPQDAAQFECVVSNEVGEARRQYQVTIHVPPTIADDQTDFTVTQMAPVVLTCHSSGVPAPVVSWSKAGLPLGARGSGYRVSPSGALEIGQALPVHAGRYTCTAQNSAGVARKHVALAVQASPVVKPLPSAVRALVEEEVLLPCAAWGVPRPSITWQKEGLSIPEVNPGRDTQVLPSGQLRITHARPEDAGNYFCIAQNSAGSAVGKTRLVVQAPRSITAVTRGPGTTPAGPVTCPLPPAPCPHVAPPQGGRRPAEGTCAHVQPGQGGLCPEAVVTACVCVWYMRTCIVPPVIETGLPDLATTEGSHALLPCTARGSPEPDITWEKDGQPVSGAEGKFSIQPSGQLLVRNSESQDAGTYTCTAENPVGRARRRVHLTILALPVFTTLPGDRSLRPGDRLWLRCAARGSPTPRIGWTVNDRPVTEGVSELDGGSTLQRVAVSREDSGTYVCWAENRVGRVQAVSFVHVKEAPVLQGEAFSYLVEPVGGSLRLDCVVHGDPAPDIHWIKDGLPLRGSRLRHQLQNGSLTIRRTEMGDSGRYQCLAENEMGAVEKVVVLLLQKAQDVTVRSGDDVALRCQATGEPAPTVEWLRAGQPCAGRRLRTLPDGSLWLERVETRDTGTYECVAHNLLGSATARASLVVKDRGPRRDLRKMGICVWFVGDLAPCPARSPTLLFVLRVGSSCRTGDVGSSSSPGTDPGPLFGSSAWPGGCPATTAAPSGTTPAGRPPQHPSPLTGGKPLSIISGRLLFCKYSTFGALSPAPSMADITNLSLHTMQIPSPQNPVPGSSSGPLRTPYLFNENNCFLLHIWSLYISQRHCCRLCGISPRFVPDVPPKPHCVHTLCAGPNLSTGSCPPAPHPFKSSQGPCCCSLTCSSHFLPQPLMTRPRPGGSSKPRPPAPTPPSTRQPGPLQGGWSQGHCWNGGHAGGGIQHLARCPAPRPGSSSMPTGLGHLFSSFLPGEPRGGRGSMIGVINGQELGVATLNASVQQEARSGLTTLRSSIGHLPASVGPLMRVLVVTIAPIYWALAGEHGGALNGHLTGGSFRQESHMEFSTGELLTMTQVARGLDPDGLLLLDVAVHGVIPESLANADLRAQDFQEDYVQTGPGQLFVGSTQRFLQDSWPVSLRCNHSIQYEAARGPQPQLVQHLQASAISAAFDPAAEALRFQLTTALQAEENEGCPEGFELDSQGEFCVADGDECASGPSPCSHSCHTPLAASPCSPQVPEGAGGASVFVGCQDVDECAWPTDLCPEGQRCVNLLGSYRCLPDCGPGFRVAADGADC
uniref:Hemicentin 2 n=1 Tax=Myotis lucifugus TaxID=59463 RepID=G1Q1L7_MYOLU